MRSPEKELAFLAKLHRLACSVPGIRDLRSQDMRFAAQARATSRETR